MVRSLPKKNNPLIQTDGGPACKCLTFFFFFFFVFSHPVAWVPITLVDFDCTVLTKRSR